MVKGTYVDKNGLRKGAWTHEEDHKLRSYVERYGHWNWRLLPKFAGLDRCGKSCRLRWMNYLRPGVRRGGYTQQERDLIAQLHHQHGSKWSLMAEKLPGRTDNAIKNYWNAHLKKQRGKTTGKEVEISELTHETSSSSTVVTSSAGPKLCSSKRVRSRVSSSDALFILESSESDSAVVVPTAVESRSDDSSTEQSCSNISSITSRDVAQDGFNLSDLLEISAFDNSFWTQPFVVESDCDSRVCNEEEVFSPLFYKWLNDANDML